MPPSLFELNRDSSGRKSSPSDATNRGKDNQCIPYDQRLHHLFYVSACVDTLQDQAIQEILVTARANNAARSITGVLIYSGAHFAQVLEGPEPELTSLMASIRRDTRHLELRTLLSAPLAERRFEGWSMGFVRDLSVGDLLAELGSGSLTEQRAARLIDLLFRRAALKTVE